MFRVYGFRGLGVWGLGFRGLGFSGLGFRVSPNHMVTWFLLRASAWSAPCRKAAAQVFWRHVPRKY